MADSSTDFYCWIQFVRPRIQGVSSLSMVGQVVCDSIVGVVGGVSALGAALAGIGIPNNSVSKYETELKNDRLLLVVHGTADDIEKARRVLSAQSVDLNVYDPLMKVAG